MLPYELVHSARLISKKVYNIELKSVGNAISELFTAKKEIEKSERLPSLSRSQTMRDY